MTLSGSTELSPYEITDRLGCGRGMGKVWRRTARSLATFLILLSGTVQAQELRPSGQGHVSFAEGWFLGEEAFDARISAFVVGGEYRFLGGSYWDPIDESLRFRGSEIGESRWAFTLQPRSPTEFNDWELVGAYPQ